MTSILEVGPSLRSSRCRSEQFAVLDETRSIGQLVVKRTRGYIVFFGEPIDAARAGGSRDCLDSSDEFGPDTFAARLCRHKQILQIAIVASSPARSMVEVMRDADDFS